MGAVTGTQEPVGGRAALKPTLDEAPEIVAEPDDPVLGTFTLSHQQAAGVQVQVLGTNGDYLAASESCFQHQPDGHQVAKPGRVAGVELPEEQGLLGGRQHLGEALPTGHTSPHFLVLQ